MGALEAAVKDASQLITRFTSKMPGDSWKAYHESIFINKSYGSIYNTTYTQENHDKMDFLKIDPDSLFFSSLRSGTAQCLSE